MCLLEGSVDPVFIRLLMISKRTLSMYAVENLNILFQMNANFYYDGILQRAAMEPLDRSYKVMCNLNTVGRATFYFSI